MELRLQLLQWALALPHAQAVYGVATALLAAAFALSCMAPSAPGLLPAPMRRIFFPRAVLYALASAFIVGARLPGLLSPLLNPDEGLFTAAAARLLHDPVFWRSVDTGSSGPLNIFPLALPGLLGLQPDFASSRLVGLLMISAGVCLLHAALAHAYSDASARIAALPVVTTIALMQHYDFAHFSGENGPVLILVIALFLLCRMGRSAGSGGLWDSLAIGLLAGLVPFAKMQGVPMALALCGVFVHLVWWQYRQHTAASTAAGKLLALGVGATLPSLAVAAYLTAFGLWPLFWESYVQTNLLFYAGAIGNGLASKVMGFASLLSSAHNLFLLYAAAAACAVAALAVLLFGHRRHGPARSDGQRPPFVAYALLWLVAASYSVGRPGNAFAHYLLLLVMPLGFFAGTLVGFIERAVAVGPAIGAPLRGVHRCLILVLLAGTLAAVGSRIHAGSHYLPQRAKYLANFRSPVAEAIRKWAPPGSTLTIWGWSPNLYVESKLLQSTRYGFCSWQIEGHPLQRRYMDEFVKELSQTRPSLFVDAMSPGMFYFPAGQDLLSRRHDNYPQLAAAVQQNYELVQEIDGVRIYRSKSPGR